jgi:hypothetical protein
MDSWGEDYVQAGSLFNLNNGTAEVDLIFDSSVANDSAGVVENYSFGGAPVSVDNVQLVPLDNAAVLTVSGLATNELYSITVSNLLSTSGTALPPATVNFRATTASWAAVGGEELGFVPQALAAGTNGFDLISGGIQMRDTYDESTFVFQSITGDFDKSVRVALQEPSSESARAGLMARESLDIGKPRPNDPFDPSQAFSRYIQVDVNPVTAAYQDEPDVPAAGQNLYEVNVRFYTGGIGSPNFDATETFTNNTAAPNYPNAWVRLKRAGNTFHALRSDNGTNWVLLGSYTFPTADADGNPIPPFSTNAFVGPNYSPEAGNIPESSDARRAFLAQFRDYGDAQGNTPIDETPPTMTITRSGSDVEIGWTGGGTLQTSTTLQGATWTDLPGSSPVQLTPDKSVQFFRVRL